MLFSTLNAQPPTVFAQGTVFTLGWEKLEPINNSTKGNEK